MNVEIIEKLKTEIKRVKKEKGKRSTSVWNESELSRRVFARLIGELSGLRFALNLLQRERERRS